MIRAPAMTQPDPTLRIRPATPADGEAVAAMCAALGAAEGLGVPCRFTPEAFRRQGFDVDPAFACLIAELDGRPMGYALYYLDYDTDQMCRSVYLGDLYVESAARRRGIGRALMAAVAAAGRRQGARLMMWNVLRSNAPARRFYATVGEEIPDQIQSVVTGDAFGRLLAQEPPARGLTLRQGTADDCGQVERFLAELLADIGLPRKEGIAERLRADGFGAAPAFTIVMAEHTGAPAGYALFWPAYDTESAARGSWLSDLYVAPKARRHGVALQLMADLARRTAARGGRYLVWLVHEHNHGARAFYRRISQEWPEGIACICAEESFERLADEAIPG